MDKEYRFTEKGIKAVEYKITKKGIMAIKNINTPSFQKNKLLVFNKMQALQVGKEFKDRAEIRKYIMLYLVDKGDLVYTIPGVIYKGNVKSLEFESNIKKCSAVSFELDEKEIKLSVIELNNIINLFKI